MNNSSMQEKDIFTDALTSQKFITDTYNTFTNECSTANIRNEFLNILNEEHQIQAQVFDEIQKRGWYQVPQAEQQMVSQAKQKYQNSKPQ